MNESKLGYYAMAAFVLLGVLSVFTKNYTTAVINIAIGIVFGGSGQKPWDQQSPIKKFAYGALLLVSVVLFVYVIITDIQAK